MKIIIIIIKCFKKKVHNSNIKILYYDELDLSEGIDVNNTATLASESAFRACIIWYYWYFLDKRFQKSFNQFSATVVKCWFKQTLGHYKIYKHFNIKEFFVMHKKISKENVLLWNIEIAKRKFYYRKNLILLGDVISMIFFWWKELLILNGLQGCWCLLN